MTPHISAKKGEIAEAVLMPGDPLRAKFIAENFLEDAVCHNEIRGMLGYTGTYKGKQVSVQGSGMGIPSFSIYADEMINVYGAKKIIRIGSCGSIQDHIKIRDVIMATSACTDSAINKLRFGGMDFAPTASPELLFKGYEVSKKIGIEVKAGSVFTSDTFYKDVSDGWKLWAKFGVLASEMEVAALYTLAAKYHIQALAYLTVSDSIVTHEATSPEERQLTFTQMMQLALETIIAD